MTNLRSETARPDGLVMRLLAISLAFYVMPLYAALDAQRVQEFIEFMVTEHGFQAQTLGRAFAKAEKRQSILKAMSKPAEGKPWHAYRPIFLTAERVAQGGRFWQTHAATLAAARDQYGVPEEIVVAIIGVETFYGRHTGTYPVIDALSTLAFHYPPRAKFFRAELEQFLLLAREEKVDPTALTGSYAGAMGMPQFISSSFRHYAVDFNEDGRRDIWADASDAIGSVANYLREHGWKNSAPIAARAVGKNVADQVTGVVKPAKTLKQFAGVAAQAERQLSPESRAMLLRFETRNGSEYWFGFDNFYAITRYNRSPKYALAVTQLAEAISESAVHVAPPKR